MANIRRTITHIQHTHEEGGKPVAEPTLLVAAAAIIKNPWFGRGYVEDLTPEIHSIAPVVGKTLTDMVLAVTGDAIRLARLLLLALGAIGTCHGNDAYALVRQSVS